MQESIRIKNSLGFELTGVLHTPDTQPIHAAGIIIGHGFPGSKESPLVVALANGLEQSGHIVLRLDFTGFGESGGAPSQGTYSQWVADYKKAVDYLYSLNIRRIGVVGFSQGAGCGIVAAAQDSRINVLVSISPGAYPSKKLAKIRPDQQRELSEQGSFIYQGKTQQFMLTQEYFDDLSQYDLLSKAALVHQPVLIIHGESDTTNSPRESQKIFEQLGSDAGVKRRKLLQNADHTYNNYKKDLLEIVTNWTVDWFKNFLKRENHTIQAWLQHDDKVLLLKRSADFKNYPNMWFAVGGYIDNGHSSQEQALVEFREELGITSNQVEFVREAPVITKEDKNLDTVWHVHPLLFKATTDKLDITLDWEHTEYRWIDPVDIENYEYIPGTAKGLASVLTE